MLETLKELLGLSDDDSKDTVLEIYLTMATKSIGRYLNILDIWTDDDETEYEYQIILLAEHLYDKRNDKNVISKTQGSRSITLDNNNLDIPSEIKGMLPYPRVRVMG